MAGGVRKISHSKGLQDDPLHPPGGQVSVEASGVRPRNHRNPNHVWVKLEPRLVATLRLYPPTNPCLRGGAFGCRGEECIGVDLQILDVAPGIKRFFFYHLDHIEQRCETTTAKN